MPPQLPEQSKIVCVSNLYPDLRRHLVFLPASPFL